MCVAYRMTSFRALSQETEEKKFVSTTEIVQAGERMIKKDPRKAEVRGGGAWAGCGYGVGC